MYNYTFSILISTHSVIAVEAKVFQDHTHNHFRNDSYYQFGEDSFRTIYRHIRTFSHVCKIHDIGCSSFRI